MKYFRFLIEVKIALLKLERNLILLKNLIYSNKFLGSEIIQLV